MSFITAIEKYHALPKACKADLSTVLQPLKIRQGRFVVTPGQVNTHLYFVEKGLARVFYEAEARVITSRFVMEGDFLCSVPSFFGQIPSNDYIEALEDCTLAAISSQDYQRLLDQYPTLGNVLRKIYEKHLQLYEVQSALLRQRDPVKQYERFLALYPKLACRIRAKHIASYFNVHPSTISKVRKVLKDKG